MANTEFQATWHIEGQFDDDISVEIRSADDLLVCEIEPYCESWTEAEIARVRLMAAAPKLLAALLALRDGIDTPELHCDPVDMISSWRYVIDKALEGF